MPRFANVYWSPDYRTSIERLTKQLVRSLGQLHELRKLIFHHIKYHHANGEFLAEFAHSSYDKDSNFRSFKELNEAKHVSRLRNISELTPEEFDLKYVFTKFVERTATELHSQLALASEIDGAVLDKLTEFIKHHEPQINLILSRFEELFQDYETSYEKIENLKLEYDTLLRLAEFKIDEIADDEKSGVDTTNDEMPDVREPSIEPTRPLEISLPPPPSTDSANQSFDEIDIKKSDDFGFTFPLTIASGLHFENLEELADFLTALTRSIEVTKRKIPIPGRTNELFSSVQICDHFTKERPRGFNPTRSNLEKLGQNLMNLKIIVGTSFFAKKFTSDAMWFEWSEKVMRVVQGKPVSTETAPVSLPSQMTKTRLDDTQKFVNDMAASTSKTFNGMFKSMKTSLMRPKHGEDGIRIVEANYNEAYEELQRSKHLLDMEIYDKSQYFEHFEKLKIEVIFQSLTKLLEVIYKHSLQSTTSMHDFTLRFIEEYNKQENYNREFHNTIKNFSSGIYFPSFIAPDYLTRDNVSISQLNTNFQNIKLGFNLYKDIPLQLKVSDLVPPIASHPLNVRSIPIFLYEIVNHLNNLDTDIQSYWFAPIKHQEYWLVKYEIINMVQEFVPQDGLNVHDHNAVESAIILKVISVLKDKDASKIVNFLKNWLLEISDSIIPSTVYDSLINIYKRGNNSETDTTLEIDRVLRTIPRSNLSSVIHILEHISKIFDLNSVQTGTKEDLVEGIIRKLNLMDAIGTVPFVHLILRPSVVKNATGFKPPTVEYDAILSDLANIDVRSNLKSSLIESETKFLEKQEQKSKNLGLAKNMPFLQS
ncbi:CIC11C00000001667 [Sungouiella intermedia]|uniref:CIC11C00000001667 n=1 Tax=Sungouiella intermedia TaxID=45354 RepID=A0A1L0CYG7_9ASCO|nr:CIC11C00000001667 [[Candida] intermedia]